MLDSFYLPTIIKNKKKYFQNITFSYFWDEIENGNCSRIVNQMTQSRYSVPPRETYLFAATRNDETHCGTLLQIYAPHAARFLALCCCWGGTSVSPSPYAGLWTGRWKKS
jgi:hypothetical protein